MEVGRIMRLIFVFIWIFVAWRFGDWKNWSKYYPTMLFYALCDMLYLFLTKNYPLWRLEPSFPLNHTFSVLVFDLIVLPCTVLVFLSKYPQGLKRAFYILFFVLIYSSIEWILYKMGSFSYFHGWNWYWSVLFNCVMFPIMRLHFKYPIITILLSVSIATFLMLLFKVPLPEQ